MRYRLVSLVILAAFLALAFVTFVFNLPALIADLARANHGLRKQKQ